MSAKKILFLILPMLLLATTSGYSQIITSKKEAVKKGVYTKPSETKKISPEVEKTLALVGEKPKAEKAVAQKTAVTPEKTKAVAKPKSKKAVIVDKEEADLVVAGSSSENYLSMQLINNAMEFLGVRYRGGGSSRAGMDCSGMVSAVFNIFDIKLPRSSHDMAAVGEKVDSSDVKKGDLIFFKTNGRKVINHVGLVIEKIGDEIKFIHSSTSKGVMVSSTKESYYHKNFAQVNRVVD